MFTPSGFFVLRTPLLPWSEFGAWGNCSDTPSRRAHLQTLLARPAVREAVFLASPDLEAKLSIWYDDPESEQGQKIEQALVRYVARMAGRATPFGLFAGCSTGTLGVRSRFTLPSQAAYERHTRLDMDYVFALTQALAGDPALKPALTYRPNSSLYRAGGRLRYAEARLQGRERTYHLVAVAITDYLERTLARAADGASPLALAAALVADDKEVTLDEAHAFVEELIDSQLLVPELTPAVTGPEPVSALIQSLQELPAAAVANRLAALQEELAAVDRAGIGVAPDRYRGLAASLAPLPAPVELPRLFQVDMTKPTPALALGPEILAEVQRGVELLRRLHLRSGQDALARFREAFQKRYENREMPLTEVLDEEIGIGFATNNEAMSEPLLAGLALPGAPAPPPAWQRHHERLLAKLARALAEGAQEIELEPRDLPKPEEIQAKPLPASFHIMMRVAASSEAAVADGQFRLLLEHAGGPSGARLLGRFAHGDAALRDHVEGHLRAEEALVPDAIYAEIAHLPEGRIGNVLLRPVLRPYEIPYLGRSGAPAEQQIPVGDLLVSVRDNQVVLRSKRLGCRVIPRLTTAHNWVTGSLGVYRFLCALQSQGVSPMLAWDWGPLEAAPFLPRVVSGRLVLALARWRVNEDEIATLASAQGEARTAAIADWRARRSLPRYIVLADGDNALPVDLDNPLSVNSFLTLLRSRKTATLHELFPDPDQLCVTGPEGRFMHELILPCVSTSTPAPPRAAYIQEERPIRFTFPPGSEWLYAKVYTGMATSDQILTETVGPLVTALKRSGAIDRWFFIRYADPEWHLRLRFHGSPERLQSEAVPALQAALAPLFADGRVWRLQYDTYVRETDRYGGPLAIELAEELFHADSDAVVAILAQYPGDYGLEARWRLALPGIDLLLTDLGFDLAGKSELLSWLRTEFAAEFRSDSRLKTQLGERFRQERKALESLLSASSHVDGAGRAPGMAALHDRSRHLAPVGARLLDLDRANRLTVSRLELAASCVHMHVNRLVRSAQRAQELVLYDYLARLYGSSLARTVKKS
jgi:lantibiotic biosynthesis protein